MNALKRELFGEIVGRMKCSNLNVNRKLQMPVSEVAVVLLMDYVYRETLIAGGNGSNTSSNFRPLLTFRFRPYGTGDLTGKYRSPGSRYLTCSPRPEV
ncbi:hypothetical protein AVEN_41161-1 [Araneus ventricosus]|uniref:Uncharacterized protein n=1 Tax=Araneus ventricosus TaxID=182803 RepID=A0A4Y2WEI3_ARAVE|nr:hypothetical protein AVEN_41161-1 [Araneus ventricosus]